MKERETDRRTDKQTDRDTERERDRDTARERVPSACLTTFIVHVQLLSIKQLPKN